MATSDIQALITYALENNFSAALIDYLVENPNEEYKLWMFMNPLLQRSHAIDNQLYEGEMEGTVEDHLEEMRECDRQWYFLNDICQEARIRSHRSVMIEEIPF